MDLKKRFASVKKASQKLSQTEPTEINKTLEDLASRLVRNSSRILAANQRDLESMNPKDPKYDRLLLNEKRIKGIANDLLNVSKLASPLNEVLEQRRLPNGLNLKRIRVPFGVIAIIYEARPNVTVDSFALCFKSGNACILKGGSDAENSNIEIVKIIHEVFKKHKIDPDCIFLMPVDRKYLVELLDARGFVEVIIPRGSQNLIKFAVENATVPVIETGAGIVHTYFDKSGDFRIGAKIIFNAKTRRPSVCNALDTLIIHKNRLADLTKLVAPLKDKNVELFCDHLSYKSLRGKYPLHLLRKATKHHFGIEFLSLKMSIKTVKKTQEAIEHITKYSSRHSEAIISEDKKTIDLFLKNVDAACVYANTSTAFTDGAQFGLGAEIGISTQKLHARGPMALRELTSYKWVVEGNGQIRQ